MCHRDLQYTRACSFDTHLQERLRAKNFRVGGCSGAFADCFHRFDFSISLWACKVHTPLITNRPIFMYQCVAPISDSSYILAAQTQWRHRTNRSVCGSVASTHDRSRKLEEKQKCYPCRRKDCGRRGSRLLEFQFVYLAWHPFLQRIPQTTSCSGSGTNRSNSRGFTTFSWVQTRARTPQMCDLKRLISIFTFRIDIVHSKATWTPRHLRAVSRSIRVLSNSAKTLQHRLHICSAFSSNIVDCIFQSNRCFAQRRLWLDWSVLARLRGNRRMCSILSSEIPF